MHAIYVLHGQPDGAPLRGVTRNGSKIATQTAFVPFDEVRMHGGCMHALVMHGAIWRDAREHH
jgi:hypothetical protein